MPDQFRRLPIERHSPGVVFNVITPSDGADIPLRPRSLYIGTAGNLVCMDETGTVVTFPNVPVGFAPISPVRIRLTGTTAGNIIGLT